MVAKDITVQFPVKLISADLKDVTSMTKGCVEVSIAGQLQARREAHLEKDAGKSLKWNDEVNLFVRADMLAQDPNLPLVIRIRSQDPSGDASIGAVTIPVQEVLCQITLAAYNGVERIVTYPVTRSAKPKGTLKVSFKVDDLVGTPPPEEVAQAAERLLYEIMGREGARDPSDDNKYQAGYLFDDMVVGLPVEAAREPHPHLSDHYATHSAVRGAWNSFTEKTKDVARDAVNEILDKLDAKVAPKIFKNKFEPINAPPAYPEYARPAYAAYARSQHHYSGHTQEAQQHGWHMPAAPAYATPHQQQGWHMPDAPPHQQHGWHMPAAPASTPYAPPHQQHGWHMPAAPASTPYAPPHQQHGWHMPAAPAYAPPHQQHGWHMAAASPYARPLPAVGSYAPPAADAVCTPPQKNNNFGGMLGAVVQWLTLANLTDHVAGMSADVFGFEE